MSPLLNRVGRQILGPTPKIPKLSKFPYVTKNFMTILQIDETDGFGNTLLFTGYPRLK
jgi:hypothetical protein